MCCGDFNFVKFTTYLFLSDGWVRDPEGGLLYWVPPETGLHSPALLTIPQTSPTRSVSLNFDEFVFGTSWAQILTGGQA